MRLSDLAARLGCTLDGDGAIEILRVAGLDEAGPGDVTFLANPKYAHAAGATRASAIIAAADVTGLPCAVLRSAQPYKSFADALRVLGRDERPPAGIHPTAVVGAGAQLGEGVSVGPLAVIGARAAIGRHVVIHAHAVLGDDVQVGDDSVIHARVSVRERTVLGARVVVQDGAVIGSDGFGFVTGPDGVHHKIPQRSIVVVEDDVEIGANTTIDRPAVGETRIGRGTKIDNLVQIGHGVKVGQHALLVAQAGVAGSSRLGDHVVLAGQVGVAGHVTIGDRARATAQTGIPNDVEAGALVSGYPAIDNRDWLRSSAIFRHLPELRRQVKDLLARLDALEARLNS